MITSYRRRLLRPLLMLAIGCMSPGVALGQGITGVVRDSATSAPLAGVLVSVLDVDERRVRGVLTDASGAFTVQVPLGRYRLRAERIGLRPAATELFDVRTFNPHREDVVMTDRAVEIAGLVVDARVQSCRLDPGGAVCIQRWWQEIRTALDVSSLLQSERLAEFQVDRFEREWDADLRRIIASNRRTEVSTSNRPFVSEEADFLSRGGFVQGDITGQREYFAPDADVLLSDVFLSEHCFSLAEDGDRDHQLGLRFEPSAQRAIAEIRGTLWVDTTTAELQDLEFTYTNVPDVPENDSGGRVEFEYLPTGAWIVSQWYIRMPRVGVRERRDGEEYVLVGYVDVGGDVELISGDRPADVPGVEGAIRGTVFDSIRGKPLPDARVTILGTRFQATTDAAGDFVITNVPAGRHNVTFAHVDTELWGLGAPFVEVDVRERLTSDVSLAVPGFRQAALSLCLGGGRNAQTVIVGHALDRDRQPMQGLALELSWAVEVDRGRARTFDVPVRAGSDGRFIVCTVPGEVVVSVRAEVDGRWVDVFEVTPPMHAVTYREVWFTR